MFYLIKFGVVSNLCIDIEMPIKTINMGIGVNIILSKFINMFMFRIRHRQCRNPIHKPKQLFQFQLLQATFLNLHQIIMYLHNASHTISQQFVQIYLIDIFIMLWTCITNQNQLIYFMYLNRMLEFRILTLCFKKLG